MGRGNPTCHYALACEQLVGQAQHEEPYLKR